MVQESWAWTAEADYCFNVLPSFVESYNLNFQKAVFLDLFL